VYLFTKGADDVVKDLCTEKNTQDIQQVNQFAAKGLRTLMLAMKKVHLSHG